MKYPGNIKKEYKPAKNDVMKSHSLVSDLLTGKSDSDVAGFIFLLLMFISTTK